MKYKKLTASEKYASMKRQAEDAGMRVYENKGKLKIVKVKKK